jgi:hypothetical protein
MVRMIKLFLLALFPVIVLAQSQVQILPVELRGGSLMLRSVNMVIEGENHYLPWAESFTAFGIKSSTDSTRLSIKGFFRSAENNYSINLADSTAEIDGNSSLLSPGDFSFHNGAPYFNISFFKRFFGIDLEFNQRRLVVLVKNPAELPSVVAMRRLQSLDRIQHQASLPEPEVSFGRDYHVIGGGLVNWTLSGVVAPYTSPTSRNTLNFGVKTFGGDFTGRWLNSENARTTSNTFRGNFRYPFFETSALRQIIVGDMFSNGVLSQEITGVEITNRPAAVRRFFTRDLFRGNVDPGMEVAFYGTYEAPHVQNTDETGTYQFDAPVLYGNGLLEMHAFDIWGQERVIRYRMTVPQSLIPPGEFQYSVEVGKNRDRRNAPTALTNTMDWGVTPEITLGTSFSYYNITTGRQGFGGFTGTGRIARNVVLSASVIPFAYGTGSLIWEFPSTARIGISDRRYSGTNLINPTGLVNDLEVSSLVPVRLFGHDLYMSVLGTQSTYEVQRQDELQASVSTTFGTMTPSLTSRYVQSVQYGDGITTQVNQYVGAVSFIMPAGLHMLVDATYNQLTRNIDGFDFIGAKRFESGISLIFSYNKNDVTNSYLANFRLSYFLPFARAIIGSSSPGDNRYQYSGYASGSINFNTTPFNVLFSDTRGNLVGNSSFTVNAYLDTNYNGKHDDAEPTIEEGKIYYSNTTIGGGASRIPLNVKTRNKIFPYEGYSVYLDPQTLSNPMWVPEYSAVGLFAEPNINRRIDIPVVNGGIVRGSVTINAKTRIPAEGYTVTLTPVLTAETQKGVVALKKRTTSTFSTGEFEFLGVVPGVYSLSLDAAQITKLPYSVTPSSRKIDVKMTIEPFTIENQNFDLSPQK